MRNLTVTLPENVLDRLRILAAEQKMSMNKYVRQLLSDVAREPDANWQAEHAALLEKFGNQKRLSDWTREEIYEERLNRIR
jgi:hypothetical protein